MIVVLGPVAQRPRYPAHHKPVRRIIAAIGAWIIYRLIWIFGRTHRREDIAWLIGPMGGPIICDASYREVAAREGLWMERSAKSGLGPQWQQLHPAGVGVSPEVRDFYEHTSE